MQYFATSIIPTLNKLIYHFHLLAEILRSITNESLTITMEVAYPYFWAWLCHFLNPAVGSAVQLLQTITYITLHVSCVQLCTQIADFPLHIQILFWRAQLPSLCSSISLCTISLTLVSFALLYLLSSSKRPLAFSNHPARVSDGRLSRFSACPHGYSL